MALGSATLDSSYWHFLYSQTRAAPSFPCALLPPSLQAWWGALIHGCYVPHSM